ncbi:hypothetical protein ccbrp13_20650 [Ktedonobacteria bacterium brp13]|nr:hypothetical protein ccbrp13_20650 [Ktedonobacteria bacterium brp13]
MTKCAFFDDQPDQPPTELPQWATITQISHFLEIPRDAVRSAVRRAIANNEAWVKKEDGEAGSTRYLIDTTHEMYQSHQERWKLRAGFLDEIDPAWLHAGQPRFLPPSSEEELQQWPHFRQWLYMQGLQIYQNVLAEEQEKPWQWRWDDLHDEGYRSIEEAVIAALQRQLDTHDAEREEQAFFQMLENQEHQKLLENQERQGHQGPQPPPHPRHSWFRRND